LSQELDAPANGGVVAHEGRRQDEGIGTAAEDIGGEDDGQNAEREEDGTEGFDRGALKRLAQQAISGFRDEFTIIDVLAQLRDDQPSQTFKMPSLQSVLRRLERQGRIVVVTRGAGRRPTVYRRGGDA
jgi:hypothetical protein